MKRFVLSALLCTLILGMLLPVLRRVNHSSGIILSKPNAVIADGWPLPPPPKPKAVILTADGWPLPPPPPQRKSVSVVLTADGWPLPPPPPQSRILLSAA